MHFPFETIPNFPLLDTGPNTWQLETIFQKIDPQFITVCNSLTLKSSLLKETHKGFRCCFLHLSLQRTIKAVNFFGSFADNGVLSSAMEISFVNLRQSELPWSVVLSVALAKNRSLDDSGMGTLVLPTPRVRVWLIEAVRYTKDKNLE